MNIEHYKAASEATDADERALIPGFRRAQMNKNQCECGKWYMSQAQLVKHQAKAHKAQRDAWNERAEHENDLRQESRETDEREASGYRDNHPCNDNESTTD